MPVPKTAAYALAAVLAAAAIAAPMVLAHDDSDGLDDLMRIVKRSRIIDLSHTWDKDSPIAGVNPPYTFKLEATHANTRGTFADNGQLSFTAEVMHFSGQHGAPNIDAIGHIGRDGKLYGGVDAAAATSDPDGIGASGAGANLAIDQFPKDLLINRGVLLDVASMVNGNLDPLPANFEITAKHLAKTARHQRVQAASAATPSSSAPAGGRTSCPTERSTPATTLPARGSTPRSTLSGTARASSATTR